MMGRQTAPATLFYDFDLEAHVPGDHLLRQVDRFLDMDRMRAQLAPFYSHLGRPSIDPELIVRMLLVGYLTGIRSERRLCDEVHLNLAHRWFCRLGLDGRVPDHSTFSKYRHGKFRDSDLLRLVFEGVVERCIEEGLVGGTGFAVDASLIMADVDKLNSSAQARWDVAAIDPQEAPRAVREYLETLDDAAFGAASPAKPKFVSHSDPASQWTAAQKGPAVFTYSDNYLIDTDNAVIVDVEATRSIRQAEIGAARTMIDRVGTRHGLKPTWVTADTAYGAAENLNWLVRKRGIVPFIPVFDKSTRTDGTWSRSDFEWDEENDRYVCPEGHESASTGATTPIRREEDRRPGGRSTERWRPTARHAPRSSAAARRPPRGTSPASSTRTSGTSPGNVWPPRSTRRSPDRGARRSRCSSRTSSASSGSAVCVYEGHVVPRTSSPSPPPPRTSGSSQSSGRR